MGIASLPLEIQLILVPTIIFALTFHEYAHARVAYLLGDYTSYYQNRMNLNPFNHLDPFGTFALYFLGFGWAKPVPVLMQNLKNPAEFQVTYFPMGRDPPTFQPQLNILEQIC